MIIVAYYYEPMMSTMPNSRILNTLMMSPIACRLGFLCLLSWFDYDYYDNYNIMIMPIMQMLYDGAEH